MACKSKKGKAVRAVKKGKKDGKGGPGMEMMMGSAPSMGARPPMGGAPSMGARPPMGGAPSMGARPPMAPAKGISSVAAAVKAAVAGLSPEDRARVGKMTVDELLSGGAASPEVE
ncbi:MAG: hypothetical protein WC455_10155 [Dehalococcoidia bacterium]